MTACPRPWVAVATGWLGAIVVAAVVVVPLRAAVAEPDPCAVSQASTTTTTTTTVGVEPCPTTTAAPSQNTTTSSTTAAPTAQSTDGPAPSSDPSTTAPVDDTTVTDPATSSTEAPASTAPAGEPDPARTPSTTAGDPNRFPSTTAGDMTDTTTPVSEPADTTTTAAPATTAALPAAPDEPLPPVNGDWQAPGVGRPPALGTPGPQPPVPGRVPPVTRGAAEVEVILATIRHLESGGTYTVGPNRAGASGAYQYIPSTWNGYQGFSDAYLAPQAVQDTRARADVERILTTYAGDVSMVPVIWYFPLAARDASWMDRVPNPAGGNRLTVREYQQRWLEILATKQAERGGTVAGQPELAAISVLAAIPEPADAVNSDVVTVSAATMALAARSAPPAELPSHGTGSMRSIGFPVLGPVTYQDGWGDCRDGCRRRHQGTDIIGVRMQPLLAAVDGTVTRIRYDSVGTAGAIVSITDADGWSYNYFHVNNDTPGSDDANAQPAWRLAPRLAVGDTVTAGQVIGYMGDSGNSEASVPHLHFEFRDPNGTAQPSFWSLQAAEARQACTIGIGPWSAAGPPAGAGTPEEPVQVTAVRPLFGDGSWLIDTEGRVTATGDAALIVPSKDLQCEAGPTIPFGTDGAGWTTAADARILEGTTLAGADPTMLTAAGVQLPLPATDVEPLTDLATVTHPTPSATPALAFREPSSGETILVSPTAIPTTTTPARSLSMWAELAV